MATQQQTSALRHPSGPCLPLPGQSISPVLMLRAAEAGKAARTHTGRQSAPGTDTETNRLSIPGGEAAVCSCRGVKPNYAGSDCFQRGRTAQTEQRLGLKGKKKKLY